MNLSASRSGFPAGFSGAVTNRLFQAKQRGYTKPATDTVQFAGKYKKSDKGAALALAGLIMLPIAGIAGIAALNGASEKIGDNVTTQNVYNIEGHKEWKIAGDFDLDVHQTETGWVVQGKKSWDLTGYKFEVNKTDDGWSARGKKDFTIGDYHFNITPTSQGYDIKGGQELTILGDFNFTATRTLTGFDIEGKQQGDLFGNYKFRMTETEDGWLIQGGHNWDLRDFEYTLSKNDVGGTLSTEDEEALGVSFPIILSMINDHEEARN